MYEEAGSKPSNFGDDCQLSAALLLSVVFTHAYSIFPKPPEDVIVLRVMAFALWLDTVGASGAVV